MERLDHPLILAKGDGSWRKTSVPDDWMPRQKGIPNLAAISRKIFDGFHFYRGSVCSASLPGDSRVPGYVPLRWTIGVSLPRKRINWASACRGRPGNPTNPCLIWALDKILSVLMSTSWTLTSAQKKVSAFLMALH